MKYAVLFPGQGSQVVGMGADLFEARPDLLGDAADEILGWSLRERCLVGPEEELTRTEHAQPALYALSFVLWEALAAALPSPPSAAAGHSLGEYTALAAARVFSYGDGLRLVAARGRAMARAADLEPSTMAALVGAEAADAEAMAAERRAGGGRLWVANLNAPGQVVVAGGIEDVAWAESHAADFGIRRVIPLRVAGGFHSPFMASAADELGRALAGVPTSPGAFPVLANATAAPYDDDVAATLIAQLTVPVRFSESLGAMGANGISHFVHVGPGDVTAGLARRSVEGAQVIAVSSLDDVSTAVDRLTEPSVGFIPD